VVQQTLFTLNIINTVTEITFFFENKKGKTAQLNLESPCANAQKLGMDVNSVQGPQRPTGNFSFLVSKDALAYQAPPFLLF
jgi:hypothetical protein